MRTNLLLENVAEVDGKTGYMDVRHCVSNKNNHAVKHAVWGHGDGTLQIDEQTLRVLEEYVNAQPPGEPFKDFRPDISPFLFPSSRGIGGLSV